MELPRRAAEGAVVEISSAASAGSIFLTICVCAQWQDIYTQLRGGEELGLPISSEPAEYREIHTALLTGLLSHIGMKDADKQRVYRRP
ncbi:hypothetical protein MJ579_13365 [Klebsiella pneumoniae]|nr:hypothetical protein MJ579_13365 [Klebsiella pneumoniae]